MNIYVQSYPGGQTQREGTARDSFPFFVGGCDPQRRSPAEPGESVDKGYVGKPTELNLLIGGINLTVNGAVAKRISKLLR